jgi:hypothetical protein
MGWKLKRSVDLYNTSTSQKAVALFEISDDSDDSGDSGDSDSGDSDDSGDSGDRW